MPLYMDFHIFEEVSIDDVKKAHIADKTVQEKYDVQYHQFWVNEEAGTVFCLMEGPDKESCEATHREAHGNVACKIEEVEPGFYQLFMGKNQKKDEGLVQYENGEIDLGYRFVLVVDIRCNTDAVSAFDYNRLILPAKARKLVLTQVKNYNGKELKTEADDNIIAVFSESKAILSCAIALHKKLSKKSCDSRNSEWNIFFKMGVTGGQPLTKQQGFFQEAIQSAQRLGLAASNREVLVAPLVEKINGVDKELAPALRVASIAEENFLHHLFDVVEENISNDHFNVSSLSRDIGVSRPQLYRKTTAIAGRSPNRFIRDLRMQKALSLIREQQYNISEVSLKVGINNPSYFSKCFHDKYGITPSEVTF